MATTFDDFKIGHRVAHIMMGDGVVTAKDSETVHVTYDRETNGMERKGSYNRRWFEINQNYLFHRAVNQ